MESDTLSIVLDHVGVQGSVFCRAELDAPWAVETRGTETAIFHVIVSGSGYLRRRGERPIAWRAGDMLLLPHGVGHVMASEPSEPAVPITSLPTEMSQDGLPCVISSGDGAHTSLLCGTFSLGDDAPLLLEQLPDVLHVAAADATSSFFDATLRLLADEVGGQRPGAHTVVARLAEILLVQALRSWLAGRPEEERGWLAALRDPVLAKALAAIHRAPGHDWTAGELAQTAGVSRSVLYTRFSERLDGSPSAYLTRWRMVIARRELLGNASIGEVAETVGYGSEAAFSRAFKREVGASPSAWRRAAS